ncbi:gliding motility-associated C-terminal domain-containing protein [Flavobacteriales bacterium]|nr:gliding motility-associated C-terminal domain-containing protein [Flavobacteriales bacterium]
MKPHFFILLTCFFVSNSLLAQYTMSNQTVYACEGTLTDSEANIVNPGWYTHNENFSFTICPQGALSITITFSSFKTEPGNDNITIYDGPNNTFPLIGGPYSGVSLPPQIISNGCITITFMSDATVAEEGFELSWESEVSVPPPPILSIAPAPTCSANVIILNLDQNIHCDSVYTAPIFVSGQINQNVSATPLNCINDSTNIIQLNVLPGLNESGVYNVSLQSYFRDACDSVWDLSANTELIINDCPLQVSINTSPDSIICFPDCVDLYANVSGGDSTSYNYNWTPPLPNSAGPHTVCPSANIVYSVIVSDAGPASDQSDNISISVLPPPVTQSNFSICQTDSALNLIANPPGGSWSGTGITNSNNGIFSPSGLAEGVYTVTYTQGGCSDDLDITILEINAGPDISVCVNAPMFNLNTLFTTPGGTWSGCNCIQLNGDIIVGGSPTIISAIYTLPNGCLDTLLVSVVNNITMPAGTTLCQQSGNYPLLSSPINGVWSVLPNNIQLSSSCTNPITAFPHQEGWENSLNGWTHDPTNDFDWMINSGGTPSGNTGPGSAHEGTDYIYTEASSPNFPSKRAAIISPCINLSEYDNPVLYFWYHKYGAGQGSFAVDVSIDNGLTWIWNYWDVFGDLGDQWNEVGIDLSPYNTSEVLIRLRVVTGNDYSSDVAVDKLSILGGPITSDGSFLTDVAISGTHNLIYSIPGCDDFVNIIVNEINAGPDQIVCPLEASFNLIGSPVGGVWSGNNITNTNLGTFNPSLGLGVDVITYSYSGCIDTSEIWVVDTDVQIDSLFFCLNSGVQQLDMIIAPRVPWNGIWNGSGITNANFPGEFNPNIAGVGSHNITYLANTCNDNLIIKVFPRSILLDTLICSSSTDIILDVSPPGGYWNGNGIINNNTGLFSPSQLGVGSHSVTYIAPNSCIDTFIINIYNSPVLSMSGLDDIYCFIDSNILITTFPNIGGVLSGDGIIGNLFNPALAGAGYHIITFTYGTGNCMQIVDTIVFVRDELLSNTYFSKDSVCYGEIISIGSNASGGIGNYSFNWNNGLSNSFAHLVSPTMSTNYIVNTSDGCSDEAIDTIEIFVYPTFNINFTTSLKACYGDSGFVKVNAMPAGDYGYLWNNNPPSTIDSVYSIVNRSYQVKVTDNITNCFIEDTISIPGYDNVVASFFPNKTECVSLLDGNVQFINNSMINTNEISFTSYWDFGDSTTANYINSESPSHTYTDTGFFNVILYLENIGGCKDSTNHILCIIPDNKLYAPSSFTPNFDNCNDEFYIKGVGGFYEFNIKLHNRWGGEIIFESDEIIITNQVEDGNSCNTITNYDSYYKMGSWNGVMINGLDAPSGVYPYIINYMQSSSGIMQKMIGYVVLVR